MLKKVKMIIAVLTVSVMMTVFCNEFLVKYNKADAENDYTTMSEELAVLINEARVNVGLKPIYTVPYLNDCAHIRARELIFKFAHERPAYAGTGKVINFHVINYDLAGETIVSNKATAAEAFTELMDSPKHRAIIMDPAFTHMGIAVTYEQSSLFGWYWAQEFVSYGKDIAGQKMFTREDLPPVEDRYHVADYIIPKSYGDINGDGSMNSFDYILLLRYICGEDIKLNEMQLESADVMLDGDINIADVITLRNYIIGIYNTLPVTLDQFVPH